MNRTHPTAVDMRPGTYSIDPARSTVAFTIRQIFGLSKVRGFGGHQSDERREP